MLSFYHWDEDEEVASPPAMQLSAALVTAGLPFEEAQDGGWIALLVDDSQLKSVVEQVIDVVRGVY